MKIFLKTNLLLIIAFLYAISAFGQNVQTIEKELVGQYEKVRSLSSYGDNDDYDALKKANKVFAQTLLKHTKNLQTLKYNFAELDKLLTIATSEDEKFRVYSWDTQDGGTMHNFAKIYQYQAADGKVYSQLDDDTQASPFVKEIYTLNTKKGKVYLAYSTGIGSTLYHYDAIKLYKITENSLDDKVKIIRTKEGLTNKISFYYNFFSIVDRPESSRKLIRFDKITGTLKISIVIETKEFPEGKVTDKFISYRFNGTNFVKVN